MGLSTFFHLIMLCRFFLFPSLFQVSNSVQTTIKRHWRQNKLFSTNEGTSSFANKHGTGDILVSGLNEQQVYIERSSFYKLEYLSHIKELVCLIRTYLSR